MTTAAVLRALGEVRFGDRYEEIDKVRDFKAALLADERGLRVLSTLADMGGWLHALPPIDMNGRETPMMLVFREGRRSVITDIMHLLANDDPSEPEVIREE